MPKPDLTPISRFPDLEKPGRERLNQLLRLLILTTRGDLLTRGATYLKRLAIGSAGQVLKVDSGGDVEWGSLSLGDAITIGSIGCDYTTIQSALDANATANKVFIVYPGTYTNDTIDFTANGQSVLGIGSSGKQHVTNTAQIMDFGAYTNCHVRNIKMTMTVTSAIDMITGSGNVSFHWCNLTVVASGTIAGSPTAINTTGTVKMKRGAINYTNTATSTDKYKRAINLGAGADVDLKNVKVVMTGSGTADGLLLSYGVGTGVITIDHCVADLTDANATYVVLAAIIDGSGSSYFMHNDVHCTATAGTAIGLYLDASAGTDLTFRSIFNHIHSVGGTAAYSFLTTNNARVYLVSMFDSTVAAGGISKGAASNVKYVFSKTAGNLDLSGDLTADNVITGTQAITDNAILTVDGDPGDTEHAVFTAAGLAGLTDAELLAALTGDAGATFSWNDQILSAIKGLLLTAASELTMDTNGAITVTQMVHTVDTFEDAASDDLVTINGGTTVGLIILRPASDARTVVVKDGGGNIELQGGADITLDDITDHIMLFWDTTNSKWVDFGGGGAGMSDLVDDATPQLGGDLDLNGNNIDFPTTADVSDCKDEDDMASNSATMLATQQSIKAYADTKASITTATQTVYVDGDASGAADGTSWTDAFTTIQAAWDSLPAVIAHAVTIKCREATNPYRETIDCDERYVIASVTIEGEHYAYGDCEANVGGAGEITDTGAFGDVAVGDTVFVIDMNGANGRAQNCQKGLVDSIANEPNRIGTNLTLTPTTNWKYCVVRTEVSGSDNGTDGGTARDYCFAFSAIDNVKIYGFLITFSDKAAIYAENARTCELKYCIFEDCDGCVHAWYHVYMAYYLCWFHGTAENAALDVRYWSFCGGHYSVIDHDGATGVNCSALANFSLSFCMIIDGTRGITVDSMGYAGIFLGTITNGVGTGIQVYSNGFGWEYQTTNSATVDDLAPNATATPWGAIVRET